MATVLHTSIAPTGEQLATVAQKHLPQRTCPLRRWPNLGLNSYTAWRLNRFSPDDRGYLPVPLYILPVTRELWVYEIARTVEPVIMFDA